MHFGIVEDIMDPQQLGRVRVRIFGLHTYDKTLIPSSTLPWASVVQPTTSAANSGVGQNPNLLLGSLVVVFFADGEAQQLPVVLGSLPSEIADSVIRLNGKNMPRDPEGQGFQDPSGFYPTLQTGMNDLPLPSKEGNYKNHPSYAVRYNSQYDDAYEQKIYPTATAEKIPTVAQDGDDVLYNGLDWTEPLPADNQMPTYPDNVVRVSASGITEEWDDSPESGPRTHRFHPSGTYEEIINDGSKTIKVIGRNHEIYMNGSNIYIEGDVNFTIHGNKRELVTGNYILEVEGDVHHNFHQSVNTKIGERCATEIGLTHTVNIGEDETRMIGGDQTETTIGAEYHIVNGTQATQVSKDASFQYSATYNERIASDKGSTVMGNSTVVIAKDFTLGVAGNRESGILGNDDLTVSKNRTINVTGNDDTNVTGNITQDANTINLNSGTDGAARINDSVDSGDGGATHADGSNIIETGSSTVFIGG